MGEVSWRLNLVSQLHWWQFGQGSYLVFNRASGQTHIINELCVDAIQVIEKSPDLFPLDLQALARMLAQRNEFLLDEEWINYIDQMLAELDQLGLIEPIIP
ncbi:MAG: HPr-rel-A system PqqD family peptide chaperone [Candidatus Competibacteraceae bacterium]|nr:HPr-rel-A system PqqD family peptide chaperone [Candidatus Competibacteraceae bacterium]